MGLNLGAIGRKIEDIIGTGLGNIGNAAEGLVGIHPTFNQPQQQQQPNRPAIQQPQQQNPFSQFTSPFVQLGHVIQPLGQGISNFGDETSSVINKYDKNLNLPVVGNVGDTVGGFIKSPGQTITHAGQVLQGQNPYAGMSPTQTAGSAATDALNALTFGKGKLLADAGEAIARPVVGRLGGGTLAKAAGNFVGTTAATAPVTGAYGAAGVLQQNDSNPSDIGKGFVRGLAAAPVLGTVHATVPVVKQGVALARPLNDATVSNLYGVKGTLPEKTAQPVQTTPEQITPQKGPSPGGQTAPVTPKAAKASSSAKPTIKLANNQPPDELAQALELEHNPPMNAVTSMSDSALAQNVRNEGVRGVGPRENTGPATSTAIESELARQQSAENNPVKITLPTTQAGDYVGGRATADMVSNPTLVRTEHAAKLTDALTPSEKQNFWNMVENPELAKSKAAKEAVAATKDLTDTAHATSQALGGDTGYVRNYDIRNVDLEDKGTQQVLRGLNGGQDVHPEDFQGIDRVTRQFATRAEAEAAGVKFKNSGNPAADIREYGQKRAAIFRKQGVIKGMTEADAHNPDKTRSLDLGNGQVLPLSEQGLKEAKAFQIHRASTNPIIKGVRTVNTALKSTILSLGQFHTINIGALRAAPTLIMRGHPREAAVGLYRMFRGAFGSQYADHVIGSAIRDGTVDKAAKIGMPYGGGGYNVEGTFLKHGVGSRTVFGKQIPMMHDQVARSIISDLEKKNIPLDSPEAREAGLAGANLMGEMNHSIENLSPRARQAMSDWMLAGQFTPSKFEQSVRAINPKSYTKGGVAGKYAAANVLANVAATTAIATGIGYALKQNSDNVKDILLRALVDPAVPTPLQDKKGNTIKLRLPGTNTSDIAKLLGIKLVRNNDTGHLSVSWSPGNMPSTVEDFLRARLGPLPGAVVKVATNSSYAGKPLFDPNASFGTKVAQAGTTLATGSLPIGLQGAAYTDFVKNHVPGAVKDVLDANTPGSSPIVKSIGSSFGLTPSTDQTVGKGQQSAQYFDALDKAKQGLNKREQDAVDIITGGKKNPVTGKYEIDPTVYDTPTKANLLLQNPKVLQNLTALNQKLGQEGQKVDPFYSLSPDQQVKALQIDRLDPQNPDKTQNIKLAGQWYDDYQKQRQSFFDSLPPEDPNKPKSPVQFVSPSASVQSLMDKYGSIDDAGQKAQFIKDNPAVQQAFDQISEYDKQLRAARGDPELKGYPKAGPDLQAKLDKYNTLDKASRSAYIKANPDISNYFQQVSQYTLENDATQARYVGNDFTPKGVKAIQSLGNDIYYNGGLTGSSGQTILPTGAVAGVTGASSTRSKSRAAHSSSSSNKIARNALRRTTAKSNKVTLAYGKSKFPNKPFNYGVGFTSSKVKSVAKKGIARPKVSLKSVA